jgi:hypothetical protein
MPREWRRPRLWAVVITPILNILKEKGFGCAFIAPFSATHTRFSGHTDLAIAQLHSISHQDVIHLIQDALTTWETGLNATSGAIIPEKTFWFLIDFKWSVGKWQCKTINNTPGNLYVRKSAGETK